MTPQKKIYFIYWANKNYSIIRNIVNSFNKKGFYVVEVEVKHLQHTKFGKIFNLTSNTSIFNICYLLLLFVKFNFISLLYRNIFCLGPNTIYFIISNVLLEKKIFVHYNELPCFVEDNYGYIKKNIEYILFNRVKDVVVSNKYRLELLKKVELRFHNYFILDNIIEIENRSILNNKENMPSGVLNLVYIGILNSNRLILDLIEQVSKNNNIKLILAGYISKEDEYLISIINSYNNIEYRGLLSKEDIVTLINTECDFGLAFYTLDSLNNLYCAPLKIHEFFNHGKIVISLENPPLIDIENKYGIVYTIPSLESLSFDEFYRNIYNRLESIDKDSFSIFLNQSKIDFLSEIDLITKSINE